MSRAGDPRVGARMGRGPYLARAQQLALLRARARRRHAARQRILTAFLALIATLFFAIGANALDRYDYYTGDLPDPSHLSPQNLAQATTIFDRKGRVLYVQHKPGEIRTVVPLAKISPLLQKATVDLEDRNFYQHHGLDYPRLAKAAYSDLTHSGIAQGGSTITQQLVKSLYTGQERSLDRKIKEALLAGELENRYSKSQILEAYLNEIFYGHQSYGIEAASETYFGKTAAQLDLNEASLLAGIPQAPSYYDPLTPDGLALTRERQRTVLDAMVRAGDIPGAEADSVDSTPPQFHPNQADQVLFAPHFVNYVLQYLRQHYGNDLVEGGGLRVTTTLDLDLQQHAEAIVRAEVAHFGRSTGINNGATVALDPNTGQILAYVGSADYNNKQIDGAVDNVSNIGGSRRQPGSSFKPYVYLTAFANGYTPGSIVNDHPVSFPNGNGTYYSPHDFDNHFEGSMTIRRALVESRNIPPIELMNQLSPQRVIQTARILGIKSPLAPVLSTAIGSSGVSMLEHAAGYSVFAAEGVRNDPTPLLKVEDAEGRTLYQFTPGHGKRVVSAQLAYEVDDILLGYAPYWHVEMMGPTAGKSGTTDDNADLWYMGYTPDLVVASWMAHTGHNPNGTPVGRYSLPAQFGVTTAVYIFRDLLPVFYHGRGIPQFQRPGGVSGGKVPCGLASPSPRRFRTPSPLPSPSPLYCGQGELRLEH